MLQEITCSVGEEEIKIACTTPFSALTPHSKLQGCQCREGEVMGGSSTELPAGVCCLTGAGGQVDKSSLKLTVPPQVPQLGSWGTGSKPGHEVKGLCSMPSSPAQAWQVGSSMPLAYPLCSVGEGRGGMEPSDLVGLALLLTIYPTQGSCAGGGNELGEALFHPPPLKLQPGRKPQLAAWCQFLPLMDKKLILRNTSFPRVVSSRVHSPSTSFEDGSFFTQLSTLKVLFSSVHVSWHGCNVLFRGPIMQKNVTCVSDL